MGSVKVSSCIAASSAEDTPLRGRFEVLCDGGVVTELPVAERRNMPPVNGVLQKITE